MALWVGDGDTWGMCCVGVMSKGASSVNGCC